MEFSGIAPLDKRDRLQLFGDKGMLIYDFETDKITGGRLGDKEAVPIEIPKELEQRWSVEEDFIAAVRSPANIHPHPGFKEGVRYMRVVQAVADSIAGGRELAIEA
jgi:predicted dehydrogenase